MMVKFLCVLCFMLAFACSPSPPPLLTPQQEKVSVEWTSENRSEELHKKCETKGTTDVGGDDDRWREYNARLATEKSGADVASIIYDNFGTWTIMMYCCKCMATATTAPPDSGVKEQYPNKE